MSVDHGLSPSDALDSGRRLGGGSPTASGGLLTNDVLAAQRNLESSIAHVSGMVKNFQAQIAATQSTIDQATNTVRASIGQATSNAQATVGQATSNAKATIGQVTSNAQAAVKAAGQKASSDLAAGKQKEQPPCSRPSATFKQHSTRRTRIMPSCGRSPRSRKLISCPAATLPAQIYRMAPRPADR